MNGNLGTDQWHDGAMTSRQLLLRENDGRPEGVELVPNPSHAEPWDLVVPESGQRVPLLGNRDFIRLASGLVPLGYEVQRTELRDSNSREVRGFNRSEVLADLLNEGLADEALAMLASGLSRPMFIWSIEFRLKGGVRLVLDKRGRANVALEDKSPRDIASDIVSTWSDRWTA